MVSQIDLAIAVGLFFTFITFLIAYLVNYIVNYTNLSSTSELRTVAYNLFISLFADKGIPKNWPELRETPLKVGIVTDMHRVPLVVVENSSTNRGLVTLNVSLAFDLECERKAWNNTVKILNSSNLEIPITLFNQTFCSQQFLRNADVAFNNTFLAGDIKNFSIYFSPDKNITGHNYSLSFPSMTNFTFIVYPEEKFTVISVEKLTALRRLNYTEFLDTLSGDYNINLEISQ